MQWPELQILLCFFGTFQILKAEDDFMADPFSEELDYSFSWCSGVKILKLHMIMELLYVGFICTRIWRVAIITLLNLNNVPKDTVRVTILDPMVAIYTTLLLVRLPCHEIKRVAAVVYRKQWTPSHMTLYILGLLF